MWGSTGPLTQVIATLVENALAHGGGRTTVKVRRNQHSTVVEVSDEGPGIDPELGARIFERSVSGRSSRGTGVGLALARTLVEDDGGRLELLTENPDLSLEISGHTSSEGDAERNRALSQARAEVVKAYLVRHGVAAARLSTIGHGADLPIADNATEEGRRQNRRIEFKVIPPATK